MSGKRETKISTPLVVGASSAMVVVGIFGWFLARAPEQQRAEVEARAARDEVRVDDRTAEAASESFYDAWRRRAWDDAERLSTGEARARVEGKRADEAAMDPIDREAALRLWSTLAGAPLTVLFTRSRELEGGRVELSAEARYEFVGRPYRREVSFVAVREGSAWRIERMTNGAVITPLPDLLELEGE